jgi:hypothetical protein
VERVRAAHLDLVGRIAARTSSLGAETPRGEAVRSRG